MKRRDFFGLMACASAGALAAPAGFDWQRVAEGIQFRLGRMTKRVLFYGPGLVRVVANLGETYTAQPSLVVVARPKPVAFEVSESANTLAIAGPAIRITVDKRSGSLAFFGADGKLLTRERELAPTELRRVEIAGSPTYALTQTFTLTPDESLYGLGQYNEPYMDYRGRDVLMVQTNIGIVVPFMVSTRRWGLLW
ncbi:MAG TPA: hypothetical protein VGQ91_01485, partial [Ideonella sp.]|nr:hypothetical protein [Ideonella sp.]